MSRPYVPGVWARKYENLPRTRKDEVIRSVNKLFQDRTGVTKKLDPERDKDLVRLWLRLRDAVVSGGATIPAVGTGKLPAETIQMQIKGSPKRSLDGVWFEVGSFGSRASSPEGGQNINLADKGVDVTVSETKHPDLVSTFALLMQDGFTLSRVLVQFNAPSLATSLTLSNVNVGAASNQGSIFTFTLLAQEFKVGLS